jgi:putative MATE family efflux protein
MLFNQHLGTFFFKEKIRCGMDSTEKYVESELIEKTGTEAEEPVVSITKGNIRKAVWGLAWPVLVTNILMTITGLMNAAFVGRLGYREAMAAVGLSEQILMVIFSVVMSVAVGTTALVARFTGAGERQQAEEAARQSLWLSLCAAAVAMVPLIGLAVPLLRIMGASGLTLGLSSTYLRIVTVTMPLFFPMIVMGAIFRGLGDTRTPMRIMAWLNVLAVALDYVLILGPGPFPRLGLVGAAISSNIARIFGFTASVWYLARSPLKGCLRLNVAPSWSWFRRILAIGIPSAFQAFLRTGGSMVFVGILGRLPDSSAAIAALTIGLRTEAVSFMPGLAFSAAATSMVGQNLGAKQPKRAESSGWQCVRQALAFMLPIACAYFFLGPHIAAIFTSDPKVVDLTASYLRANALGQPGLAFGMVLSGALQGAGETQIPAWVTLITMWGVRLPAAHLVTLILGYGAVGAWWTMTASSLLYGAIIAAVYKRGKWKTKEV